MEVKTAHWTKASWLTVCVVLKIRHSTASCNRNIQHKFCAGIHFFLDQNFFSGQAWYLLSIAFHYQSKSFFFPLNLSNLEAVFHLRCSATHFLQPLQFNFKIIWSIGVFLLWETGTKSHQGMLWQACQTIESIIFFFCFNIPLASCWFQYASLGDVSSVPGGAAGAWPV